MKNINHELARRIAGLRLFCIVICGICMLNLIRWILAPTGEVLLVNQGQMMLNLIYVIVTISFVYFLNDRNYFYISVTTIMLFLIYYFTFELLNDNNKLTIANNTRNNITKYKI